MIIRILGLITLFSILSVLLVLLVDLFRSVFVYINFKTSKDINKLIQIQRDLEKRLLSLGAIKMNKENYYKKEDLK